MAAAAILKNQKSRYLGRGWSDYNKYKYDTYKTAKNFFGMSRAVDIIRTVYYICDQAKQKFSFI